jgi:hypothetical protein
MTIQHDLLQLILQQTGTGYPEIIDSLRIQLRLIKQYSFIVYIVTP